MLDFCRGSPVWDRILGSLEWPPSKACLSHGDIKSGLTSTLAEADVVKKEEIADDLHSGSGGSVGRQASRIWREFSGDEEVFCLEVSLCFFVVDCPEGGGVIVFVETLLDVSW